MVVGRLKPLALSDQLQHDIDLIHHHNEMLLITAWYINFQNFSVDSSINAFKAELLIIIEVFVYEFLQI